jgi:WD40 repeat protein/tRNA A-37 threonylcarbamoyl transferase component Bud32
MTHPDTPAPGSVTRADQADDALPPLPPATLVLPAAPVVSGTEVPAQIPGYDILSELGRGGMGIVYKALDLKLKRFVALKMSRTGELADYELARFRAEAEAVARLRHPNIVQIYEVSEFQGRPFFAFEYVDGGSLADFLRGVPQPPRASAQLVEAVARAMHVAHQHGIIHRDLKPANILLASGQLEAPPVGPPLSPQTGRIFLPKIADFGVAKLLDKHSLHTATGAVLGTPNYMAPEQAWGVEKTRPVGPTADVYSLGAILYEMLTGRPPFVGETPLDTLQQVVTQDPVAPTRLQPKIPKDLETICLKCLQKEPPRRYASAEALAEELRCFLEDRPIQAKAAGAFTRLLRWRRRNPAVAALLVVVMLVLLSGMAVSTYFAVEAGLANEELQRAIERADQNAAESREHARQANNNLKKAEENARLALQHLRERDRLHYKSQIDLASGLVDKDVVRAVELLDGLIPTRPEREDLRRFEWYYLRRRVGTPEIRMQVYAGPAPALAYRADGSLVATAGNQNGRAVITLHSGQTGQRRNPAYGHGSAVNALAFRPDGHRLAGGCADGEIIICDASEENPKILHWKAHPGGVAGVQYLDNDYLLSGGADKTVCLWQAATGKLESRLPALPEAVECVAVHPSGELFAAGCKDGTIVVWETKRNRELYRLEGHGLAAHHIAFHPRASQLAIAQPDATVRVWNLGEQETAATLRGHTGAVNQVGFSPDAAYLASVSEDQTLRLWNPGNYGQAPLKTYRDHAGALLCLAFSGEGNLLASTGRDGTLVIRSFRTRPAAAVWKGHTSEVRAVAWSGDGKMLASSRGPKAGANEPNAGSEVIVWDPASEKPRLTITAHAQRVVALGFQPGGTLLATASFDGTARLWDTATGELVRQLGEPGGPYHALAWSPDGRRLATTCELIEAGEQFTRLTVWEAATGAVAWTLKDPRWWIDALAWSPDGRYIAGGSSAGFELRLWDAKDGTRLACEGAGTKVNALAFHRDSRLLAAACPDNMVRVWDPRDKKASLVLKAHNQPVLTVAFHPDGHRLASGAEDNLVRLWDLTTEQEMFTLAGHGDWVRGVAFRPDGEQLASVSGDGTVRIWDATPLPGDAPAPKPGGGP